jgi:hypothetical protein
LVLANVKEFVDKALLLTQAPEIETFVVGKQMSFFFFCTRKPAVEHRQNLVEGFKCISLVVQHEFLLFIEQLEEFNSYLLVINDRTWASDVFVL